MSRLEVLEQMPPFQGGGEMIQDVYLDHSTYAEPPSRFEAGTPGIAEAIGLGVACDYLTDIGMENIHRYEEELGGYLYQQVCSFLHVTYLRNFLLGTGSFSLQTCITKSSVTSHVHGLASSNRHAAPYAVASISCFKTVWHSR